MLWNHHILTVKKTNICYEARPELGALSRGVPHGVNYDITTEQWIISVRTNCCEKVLLDQAEYTLVFKFCVYLFIMYFYRLVIHQFYIILSLQNEIVPIRTLHIRNNDKGTILIETMISIQY